MKPLKYKINKLRKIAEWIKVPYGETGMYRFCCSNCKKITGFITYKYCPECGYKMKNWR